MGEGRGMARMSHTVMAVGENEEDEILKGHASGEDVTDITVRPNIDQEY